VTLNGPPDNAILATNKERRTIERSARTSVTEGAAALGAGRATTFSAASRLVVGDGPISPAPRQAALYADRRAGRRRFVR
jgi:hypothetical protein